MGNIQSVRLRKVTERILPRETIGPSPWFVIILHHTFLYFLATTRESSMTRIKRCLNKPKGEINKTGP